MKKFIIPCLCLISVFTIAGCSNTDNQTLTSLNNQLDRVESIVSSTSVNEVSAVSPYVTLSSEESYNSIQNFRALANENMLREEEIRQEILGITAQLKSCSNEKYKLGKKKNSALKTITNNLGKYSGYLNESKTQVKSSVSKIKRNLKVPNINIEEASSSYISLNNSMNERYAYLCNIHDNLEQACIILECDFCKQNTCDNCQNEEITENNSEITSENSSYTNESSQSQEIEKNQTEENNQQKGSFRIVKNIDSYGALEDKNLSNSNSNEITQNNSLDNSQNTPINNQQFYSQPPQNNMPYPNSPIPRPYPNGNYPNNFGNNAYWHGYNRINPNRNTDTFYSVNRNIDTYRYNPNFYNNYTY